jgi:hypothetical protein
VRKAADRPTSNLRQLHSEAEQMLPRTGDPPTAKQRPPRPSYLQPTPSSGFDRRQTPPRANSAEHCAAGERCQFNPIGPVHIQSLRQPSPSLPNLSSKHSKEARIKRWCLIYPPPQLHPTDQPMCFHEAFSIQSAQQCHCKVCNSFRWRNQG